MLIRSSVQDSVGGEKEGLRVGAEAEVGAGVAPVMEFVVWDARPTV